MPRSLYAKLTLALLALIGAIYVGFFLQADYVRERYLEEVRQKLNHNLAGSLLSEGVLIRDGNVDPDALEHIIHMLMVINPGIEAYVLDPGGKVLAYSTPTGELARRNVSLDPLRVFLADEAPLPLYGDDPRDPSGRKVFSAAPIGDPLHPDGYVYVILGGQLQDSVARRVQSSYTLKSGTAAMVAGLVFALLAGGLIFWLMTRRLRRLASAVESHGQTGFKGALDLSVLRSGGFEEKGGDEIDRLAQAFQGMAEKIRRQLDELDQVDRMRRELVANVSHDLRTPLASLQGYLDTLLIKENGLDPKQRRAYLEIAARQSRRLGDRVAELFELAKLDAADVKLKFEQFSLPELVQDVVQKFQIDVDRKQIRLSTERERGLSMVNGDIGLVERALENLLGNAIRHTPPKGQVLVSVRGGEGIVHVEVRDTGPGIPAEELPLIFERFYRGGTSVEPAATVDTPDAVDALDEAYEMDALDATDAADTGSAPGVEAPGSGLAAVRSPGNEPEMSPAEAGARQRQVQRSARAGSGTRGGSGLGLAITKRIVDLHHGSIQASSRPGEGTVMSFDLPAVGH